MKRRVKYLGIAGAAWLALASGAFGYYHFIHLIDAGGGQYTAAPEKFDIRALPGNTLQYFVANDGPTKFAPGDNYPALLSQVKAAAETWNTAATSSLRVAFGGLVAPGTVQAGPSVDVTFEDELPPGVLAYGGPMALASDFATNSTGTFAPITYSIVHIRKDVSNLPSYGEDFFLSIAHEFGHALGLQHTFTAGLMSTSVTRGTTKAHPLSADDVAGISVLYPTDAFLKVAGTVRGRVATNGSGVNLASVVVLAPSGAVVSSLTNPDGTYEIRGIPPADGYIVYAHPLPPPLPAEATPGNVVAPKDPAGNPVPMSGYFETRFYPGVHDISQAQSFSISAGQEIGGVDFNVVPKSAPDISSVIAYGYVGPNPVHPGPVVIGTKGSTLVATGNGLLNGSALWSGLSVTPLGGASLIGNSLQFYTGSYLMFGLAPASDTPQPGHLLFSTPTDLYVLPSGFMVVKSAAPSVQFVAPSGDHNGSVLLNGSNLNASTRVLFDGVPATVLAVPQDGTLVVAPPPGPGGQAAKVVALNPDGQSSLFAQPDPAVYTYPDAPVPSFMVFPPVLAAGADAMVEVTGAGIGIGRPSIAFGSTDVVVKQLWVKDADRLWANVSVAPGAGSVPASVTLSNGLMNTLTTFPVQVQATSGQQAALSSAVTNPETGSDKIWPGSLAAVTVRNAAPDPSWSVLINGQVAAPVSIGMGRIVFRVPETAAVGPAVLQVVQTFATSWVPPIVVAISPAPPTIVAAYISPDQKIDDTHQAIVGSVLTFIVRGLPPAIADPTSVHVSIAGVDHTAMLATDTPDGLTAVSIVLSNSVPAMGQAPVVLTYGGVSSRVYQIPVAQH